MITEKEYNNSDIVGFLVWEHEQEKIMDKEAPQIVYDMATQSLPPDEFVELERILIMLCETRGLELKIHEED